MSNLAVYALKGVFMFNCNRRWCVLMQTWKRLAHSLKRRSTAFALNSPVSLPSLQLARGHRLVRCTAVRVKSVFCAFRQALNDIAADIRNLPANYKARRLFVNGLTQIVRQHYEGKRVAGRQEPADPGGDGRIC